MMDELEVFDPRMGREYLFRFGGEPVSSLSLSMFVVSYLPARRPSRRPLSLLDERLENFAKACILETGIEGFALNSPLTREARDAVVGESYESDGTTVRYFVPTHRELDEQFRLRLERVSYEEWTIGGCTGRFAEIGEGDSPFRTVSLWDMDRVWNERETLGAASVFFGETGELLVLSRLFDRLDDVVRAHLGDEPRGLR